jgi:hypothetical protein
MQINDITQESTIPNQKAMVVKNNQSIFDPTYNFCSLL